MSIELDLQDFQLNDTLESIHSITKSQILRALYKTFLVHSYSEPTAAYSQLPTWGIPLRVEANDLSHPLTTCIGHALAHKTTKVA